MKFAVLLLLLNSSTFVFSQKLQMHYDLRHTTDPKHTQKNFPSVYFEYFKSQDSGTSFIKPGSFLFKTQADLSGTKNNIGQFYMQVSQSFRCWKPKIFVQLQYSGGLGIAGPGSYGFYISNAFSLGLGHPFQWKNAWFNIYACYTYNSFKKPSHDILTSFYWWKGLLNYKIQFAGDFSLWTISRNHGDAFTAGLHGKKISFYGEPQAWYNISKNFSAGSKINLYYHVLTDDNRLQVYPTAAVMYHF
jgi:hypothetical protein